MPRVFALSGRTLVSVGASLTRCTLHVLSTKTMQDFAEELDAAGIRYSKTAVYFPALHPLPADLVARIVKARAAQNLALKAAERARRAAN
jgi:uncharacterized protein YdhG (YjbR/CyaY superfamily)